jgi:hypothetical protein
MQPEVLAKYKLEYEDMNQPKRKVNPPSEPIKSTIKRANRENFESFSTFTLATQPFGILYRRHKTLMWFLLAIGEAAYITRPLW